MTDSTYQRDKVFISYNQNDADWLRRVQTHLVDKGRRESIDVWDNSRILPGADWRKEIESALKSARVAILLISQDFIASDFIDKYELPTLLQAATRDGLTIFPLLVSPSSFQRRSDLAKFQPINPPTETLIDLPKAGQDRYLVKLDEAVSKAFANFAEQQSTTSEPSIHQIFNVPFQRNRFFTGRDELLLNIDINFKDDDHVQALVGLPGIGKTQTAIEYAHRYHYKYSHVLWVGGNTRESLVTGFLILAKHLKLDEKNAQDPGEVVAAVKRWLDINDGWLLIIDNADELELVKDFFPVAIKGHILLTTRAHNAKSLARISILRKMSPQEGALFLLRRIGSLEKKDALHCVSEELCNDAITLSNILDGLPLALDQAAAFMNQASRSIKVYSKLFEIERAALLRERGELTQDHQSVMITFSLAFKKVAKVSSAAADIIRVCAFLDGDSIPEEIFFDGAKKLGKNLEKIAGNRLKLINAISEACRYSLLEADRENETLNIHRLTQAVLRHEMAEANNEKIWAERTIKIFTKLFPWPDFENWPLCSRMIHHVGALEKVINQFNFDFPEIGKLFNYAGWYFHSRALYSEAEPLLRGAVMIGERTLGPNHLVTASRMNNLAVLLHHRQQITEAEKVFRQVIEIGRSALIPDFHSLAIWINNFANFLCKTNRVVEAEPLYRRSIEMAEMYIPSDHPDYAMLLSTFAEFLQYTNRTIEIEQLHRRLIEDIERSLGPDHPLLATQLNGLGVLLDEMNRSTEAEPLFRRAIEIREKSVGPDHPDLAIPLGNFARLLQRTGRNLEAEPLLIRSLEISEKSLGPNNPNVARLLNHLGVLFSHMNRAVDAELKYRRALEIWETSSIPDFMELAGLQNNLANLLKNTNRKEEAECLFRRSIQIGEKFLPPNHPYLAVALNNLALLLQDTNQMEEAESLYRRAIQIGEKSLTPDHPDLATWLNNLSILLKDTNRIEEAEPL